MQEEKPAVRTTIVGGRPPGSGTQLGNTPRGMEVLVKKAVVDPAFRGRLIEQRSAVAAEIQLVLTPAEKTMLDSIPTVQLEAIIAKTRVSSKLVPIILTGTAAVILVALGAFAAGKAVKEQFQSMGIQPSVSGHLEYQGGKAQEAATNGTRQADRSSFRENEGR